MEHAREEYRIGERHACRLLGQWRGTQRYEPLQRIDENVVIIAKRPRIRLRSKEYSLLHRSVLERDGWRCQSCGKRAGLEVHHITPRSKLGHDVEENLITLC